MEECCVVCAEPLEWVGYGVCGHRDVCSKCIARLRFVLGDKHCCICKQECGSVFITKALGNYTKIMKDFDILHKTGDFWYEKNIQGFFDDKDHFTMVKAMCRLTCQLCEQGEGIELNKDYVKKGHVFRSLDLLQQHFLSVHSVQMCNLCLEGRKVFICEQKLYNQRQLECHSTEGDSEIDGIGEERGGFTGHPLCNFCQRRFYGDNELYQHMSVDHFLCHICQRLHPGQYDYFHNYDDLEVHFRHEHSLCEHPDCLVKKFVVFATDAELKRHNALTHGGNMSRSQRNMYAQIPVSFQYRHPPASARGSSVNLRNQINGRSSVRELQHTLNPENRQGLGLDISSGPDISSGFNNTGVNAAELPAATGSRSVHESSDYLTAAGGNAPSSLEESAFPPLPRSKLIRRKTKQRLHGSSSSWNRAPQISHKISSSLNVLHKKREGSSRSSSIRKEDSPCSRSVRTISSVDEQLKLPCRTTDSERVENAVKMESAVNRGNSSLVINKEVYDSESPTTSSLECDFQLTDEIRRANKALGECIRLRLGDDSKLFMAFKDLFTQFRKGDLDAILYSEHMRELGLLDLVPELVRLCPEPERQTALLNAFKVQLKGKQPVLNSNLLCGNQHDEDAGKIEANQGAPLLSTVNLMAALRLMDRGGTHPETKKEEVHNRNGYCEAKEGYVAVWTDSKSRSGAGSLPVNNDDKPEVLPMNNMVPVDIPDQSSTSNVTSTWSCGICTLENSESESKCAACETSRPTAVVQCHGKRTKKVSKFERLRLDKESPPPPPSQLWEPARKVRSGGVWKNGGGQRLVALAKRESVIDSAWRR